MHIYTGGVHLINMNTSINQNLSASIESVNLSGYPIVSDVYYYVLSAIPTLSFDPSFVTTDTPEFNNITNMINDSNMEVIL